MRLFLLSKSVTSTALDISEVALLFFGLLLVVGLIGEYAESDKLYLTLLAANPKDSELLVGHGQNLIRLRQYPEALKVFEAATKIDETKKTPDWKHGMELRVRKAGEPDFNKDTKKYGIEVFVDKNNGNLIYITETGAIAVVQDKK